MANVPTVHDLNWEDLVKDQQASGLNMRQYCAEHDIPYQAFKNHKYALQKETKGFLPVKCKTEHISLSLNGNHISFDKEIDDITLSRILKALLK